MAKFSGRIGFGDEVETSPGIWEKRIRERPYFGEVVREASTVLEGQTVLGETKTTNAFRIVADSFASDHWFDMEYVFWMGRYWSVTSITLDNRPRLTVRIGGVWNGPIADGDSDTP